MENLIAKLRPLVGGASFVKGDGFYWSPKTRTITYIDKESEQNNWALIHEAAHAKLGHTNYSSDFELLKLEVEAWGEAKDLSKEVDLAIDENHIQDCLDTYRDWLHRRSTCPSCSVVSLQITDRSYQCHNCSTAWSVSSSRFCRPYRLRNYSENKKSSELKTQTTFV